MKVPEVPIEAAATPEKSDRTPVYSTTGENDAREGPDKRVVCATSWSQPRVTYHCRDTDRHRDAVEVQADVALAPFGGPAMPGQYSSRYHHLFVQPRCYAARGRRSAIRRFADGRRGGAEPRTGADEGRRYLRIRCPFSQERATAHVLWFVCPSNQRCSSH